MLPNVYVALQQLIIKRFLCFFHARMTCIMLVCLLVITFTGTVYCSQITMKWKENSEGDLAGYRVHYGKTSRFDSSVSLNNFTYNRVTDVGNKTNIIISTTDYQHGTTLYMTTTAYDFSGNESFYAEELVHVVPIDSTDNQPPNAVDDLATTAEDTSLKMDLISNDIDVDGTIDPAALTIVSVPVNGTAVKNFDGTVVYTPYSGFSGSDLFTYTVSDMLGSKSNLATVMVNVYSGGNMPPILSLSEPDWTGDTVVEDETYNIVYDLEDFDDMVTAAFYYDTDNTGLDGILIEACAATEEGAGFICSWDTTGISPGYYYVYGIVDDGKNPPVNAYSPGRVTINSSSPLFDDNFITNTTGNYSVVNTWMTGGNGSFLYDSVRQRAQVLTGDNVGLQFSHGLSPLDTGTFSIDFRPTVKYPKGGIIYLYLRQDANNYYYIRNSDGYGPGFIRKYVNGVRVDLKNFTDEYSQNTLYTITIDFSPGLTTVNAFGEVLTINTDSHRIMVSSFEIESRQQDAYYDHISFKNCTKYTALD